MSARAAVFVIAALIGGTADGQSADAGPGRYLVVFQREEVPLDHAARVAELGGSVTSVLPQIGVSAVVGLGADGADALRRDPDVLAVAPDLEVDFGAAGEVADGFAAPDDAAAPLAIATPESAALYARQWNVRAVHADSAWRAGRLGSPDVMVVIIDTGVDYLHPELRGRVDLGLSRAFVSGPNGEEEDPGEAAARAAMGAAVGHELLPFVDLAGHGTAQASTVSSNGVRLSGMTPNVHLVSAKIATRLGQFRRSDAVRAVVYAADLGADVIGLAGGGYFDRILDHDVIVAAQRANEYAFRKGALMVGVTGNNADDNQHDGGKVRFCELGNGLCAGATAPTAAASATGPWTDVDALAAYSGYGRNLFHVVAPGGERGVGRVVSASCLTTWTASSPTDCRVAACQTASDARFGTCVYPGRGTSFAVPHVIGLAALLVEDLGHGKPGAVRQRIMDTAVDLGPPGVDPGYGHGRIDYPRALGIAE